MTPKSTTLSKNGVQAHGPSPLLLTKLYVPPARPSPVPRPRLTSHLHAGLTRRLTVISAPAGFGKSTLLNEWHAVPPASELPWAWLTLDAGDNDPHRFWEYVIVALQGIRVEWGDGALALLRAYPPPPMEQVLAALLNQLSTAPHHLMLVLDDYHLIETAAIHNQMAFLLAHLPAQIHLVIASRRDPPLPLSLWRGRGELTELHSDDLRFSETEVALLLNRVMGLDVAEDQVAALAERTEGWIVSLQMAALSMRGRGDADQLIAGFSGNTRSVTDYLVEQVLERQPRAVQDFLLQTALLERMCGPLCQAVTGQPGAEAMLAHLERANLFMIPLDGQRQWLRYHHLFAEMLRNRLQQSEPERIPVLHRRAAQWYARNDLIDEAIQHSFAADDLEMAADLVESAFLSQHLGLDNPVLARWLSRLPRSVVSERPRLWYVIAYNLARTGQDHQTVEALLDQVDSYLKDDHSADPVSWPSFWPRPEGVGNSLPGRETATDDVDTRSRMMRLNTFTIRVESAGQTLRPDRIAEYLHQLLDFLPAHDTRLRQAAYARAADGYMLCGEALQAEQAMADIFRHPIHLTDPFSIRVLAAVAWIRMFRGQLRGEFGCWQEVLKAIDIQGGPSGKFRWWSGWVNAFVGRILYEWNDLDAAANHLMRGVEVGRETQSELILFWSWGGLLLAQWNLGDVEGVAKTLQELSGWQTYDPRLVGANAAVRARVQLMSGDLDAASQWARESGISVHDDPVSMRHAFESPTFVRVLIAQGRAAETLPLLARLRRHTEAQGRMRHLIELMALQAVALQALGETETALDALQNALTLAEPEGYIRTFVDEGEPIAQLLERMVTRTACPPYVDRLLAAFPTQTSSAPQSPGVALTNRETEILGLVAQGLSNREIAEKLVVTVNTAERHLNNIYAKLHVRNRTQAVLQAKALRILPS